MNPFMQLPALEQAVRGIAAADSPAEVLRILRDACRIAAPRVGVFLVRKGQLQGWSSVGYSSPIADAQKTWTAAADPASLKRFRCESDPSPLLRGSGVLDPSFGQPMPSESVAAMVDVLGKPIALIVAERSPGETPWHPEILSLLLAIATIRLELDVVKRKVETAREPARGVPPPPPEAVALEVAPSIETRPAEAPELAAARRYARLVATDIRLYNEEAVLLGRRNGDLVRRLGEPIGRGKEAFLQRHGDLGPAALEVLHEAYVQVLAAGNPQLIPASALE